MERENVGKLEGMDGITNVMVLFIEQWIDRKSVV